MRKIKNVPAKLTKEERKALRERVSTAKKQLPEYGVSTALIHKFPELNTKKTKSKINNVLQLRAVDPDITIKLEALALSA